MKQLTCVKCQATFAYVPAPGAVACPHCKAVYRTLVQTGRPDLAPEPVLVEPAPEEALPAVPPEPAPPAAPAVSMPAAPPQVAPHPAVPSPVELAPVAPPEVPVRVTVALEPIAEPEPVPPPAPQAPAAPPVLVSEIPAAAPAPMPDLVSQPAPEPSNAPAARREDPVEELPPEQAAAILAALSTSPPPPAPPVPDELVITPILPHPPEPVLLPATAAPAREVLEAAPAKRPSEKATRAVTRTVPAQSRPRVRPEPMERTELPGRLAVVGGALFLVGLVLLVAVPAPKIEPGTSPADVLGRKSDAEKRLAQLGPEIEEAQKKLLRLRGEVADAAAAGAALKDREEIAQRRYKLVDESERGMMNALEARKAHIEEARQAVKDEFAALSQDRDPVQVVQRSEKKVVVVRTDTGSGSGFIFAKDGLTATNYHVVEGCRTISVQMQKRDSRDKIEFADVKIVAVDPDRDLCILQLPPCPGEIAVGGKYPQAALRLDEPVRSGENVFVIGNPGLGEQILDYTVTRGIISNANRAIGSMKIIQTSAPVNPGNSGGPLFDDRGNVLGVVASKGMGVEAVTFAVPVQELVNLYQTRRDAPYAVAGTLADWEKANRPEALRGRERLAMLERVAVAVDHIVSGMLVSPDGARLYLLMGADGIVQEYSIAERKVVRSYRIGRPLGEMAFFFGGRELLVTSTDPPAIHRLNLADLTPMDTTKLPHEPAGLAAFPAPNEGVLVTFDDPQANKPLFIDRASLGRPRLLDWRWEDYPGTLCAGSNGQWAAFMAWEPAQQTWTIHAMSCSPGITSMNQMALARAQAEKYPASSLAYRTRAEALWKQVSAMDRKVMLLKDAYVNRKVLLPAVFFLDRNRFICARNVFSMGKDLESEGAFDQSLYTVSRKPAYERRRDFFYLFDNILSVSPDGKYAASGIGIYDVGTRKMLKELPIPALVSAFSKDGRAVYFANLREPAIYLLDNWKESAPDPVAP
ncbi:MAG: trypsin-like peptidase domain-containing protein [Planctomycetota bacterium]|nr:trypsin-like peptidase domain-containing protein [Planctomycetota bacterium]